MIGLDRSTNLVALARKVGFSSDDGREGGGEVLVVHHVEKKGGREVLVGDVLDLGGVREGSMVRPGCSHAPRPVDGDKVDGVLGGANASSPLPRPDAPLACVSPYRTSRSQ